MKFKGEYLRKLRHETGCKQETLADTLSMSQANLSRIENGKQTLSMKHIPTIAQTMGKNPEDASHFLQYGTTINNHINDQAYNNQNVVNLTDVKLFEQILAEKDSVIAEKDKRLVEKDELIAYLKEKNKGL